MTIIGIINIIIGLYILAYGLFINTENLKSFIVLKFPLMVFGLYLLILGISNLGIIKLAV